MRNQNRQSKIIHSQLLIAMKHGEYADCQRLPRESVLSETLGISRTQLRDILASLEREGFITRRHGVGTIINRHVLAAHSRMDIEIEFLDMIRNSGYTPDVAFVRESVGNADEETAKRLQLAIDTPVLQLSRLCTADGKPVIYCQDILDKRLVKTPYTPQDLQKPIFHFLQRFCEVQAYLDLTDLRPTTADDTLSELLQVPKGAPLLLMDEVDYDIDGRPIFYSRQYFADGFFPHTILRKKL